MTAIPSTMRAVTIDGKGGPEVLKETQLPVPKPGDGEILIRVAAAGINRPDVMQRKGLYPAPKGHSEIPGLEVSGTVVAVGSGAARFKIGDPVLALVNGGGYAEYALAAAGSAIAKPDSISFVEAAAIPETFFTVWHNVFERGELKAGERFLVHGGAGGIGVTAIQLAKAFGAEVFATAGSDAKCAACRKFGADFAINYTREDFVDVIKKETGGKGVDVILDMVGGDYIERNIRSLADDGRLVNIAYQKGSTATVDFMRVMLKRLTITGSTLRIRSAEVKARIARAIAEHVMAKIADGEIKVPVEATFALADAASAHAHFDSGVHIGKIVLEVA